MSLEITIARNNPRLAPVAEWLANDLRSTIPGTTVNMPVSYAEYRASRRKIMPRMGNPVHALTSPEGDFLEYRNRVLRQFGGDVLIVLPDVLHKPSMSDWYDAAVALDLRQEGQGLYKEVCFPEIGTLDLEGQERARQMGVQSLLESTLVPVQYPTVSPLVNAMRN